MLKKDENTTHLNVREYLNLPNIYFSIIDLNNSLSILPRL